MGLFGKSPSPSSPASGSVRPIPLGVGVTHSSNLSTGDVLGVLNRLLRSYRTPKYEHLSPFVPANFRWSGSGPSGPSGVYCFDDAAGATVFLAVSNADDGTELGFFPVDGALWLDRETLTSDWRRSDASLSGGRRSNGVQIAIGPPHLEADFVDGLVVAAGYPVTPRNVSRVTKQLATMFLIKGREFIPTAQSPAMVRSFEKAWPTTMAPDAPQSILDAMPLLNPRLVLYMQGLPDRIRAMMLTGTTEGFWSELDR